MKASEQLLGWANIVSERDHAGLQAVLREAADLLDECELLMSAVVDLGDEMAEHPMPNTDALLARLRGEA